MSNPTSSVADEAKAAEAEQSGASVDQFTDADYPAEEAIEHKVARNDTHTSIARHYYGDESRAEQIAKIAPFLHSGMTIKIPPAVPTMSRLIREVAIERRVANPSGGSHPDLADANSPLARQVVNEARARHRRLMAESKQREQQRAEIAKQQGNVPTWW